MPGPAPKNPDQRARRNATVAMTRLPAAGRSGKPPKWPLGPDLDLVVGIQLAKMDIAGLQSAIDECTTTRERAAQKRKLSTAQRVLARLEATKAQVEKVELTIWADLWKTPQATQWEKRGWFREVAMFARHQAKAEAGSLDDAKEARQREDRLGLNDMSMLRLRWMVDEKVDASAAPTRRSKRGSSVYGELKVVQS